MGLLQAESFRVATSTRAAGPLLRLLQITDSSFPTGGFAFSHGVEWLTQRAGVTGETGIRALLQAYIDQSVTRQALPAALAAMRASGPGALHRVDERLDASFAAAGEREAGRIMGERLLAGAVGAFEEGPHARALLDAVRAGNCPGQYAVAFGAIARDQRVPALDALTALGFSMLLSVAQAAVRLNVIGQTASARLVARAEPQLDHGIAQVLATPGSRLALGTFTPGLDVAGVLHTTLQFRMFAS